MNSMFYRPKKTLKPRLVRNDIFCDIFLFLEFHLKIGRTYPLKQFEE